VRDDILCICWTEFGEIIQVVTDGHDKSNRMFGFLFFLNYTNAFDHGGGGGVLQEQAGSSPTRVVQSP
jgi:hypothetical protein